MSLTPADFRAFFHELHRSDARPDVEPFPWQQRLAEQVCESKWPDSLDLPTASGKTACIDVAVFAMAMRRSGPRRLFFVVDRRVVVDAAFERMRKIVDRLTEAKTGMLRAVADRLRELSDSDDPISAYQMRGGIYRDNSWVRTPAQAALFATTVDQAGSRLLFRQAAWAIGFGNSAAATAGGDSRTWNRFCAWRTGRRAEKRRARRSMHAVEFRGLEGSNPLGFLATRGAFRLLSSLWPHESIRLRWVRRDGWRPEISGLPATTEEDLCNFLHRSPDWVPLDRFEGLGKNLTVPLAVFAKVVALLESSEGGDRRAYDFAAAFGCDVVEDKDKGRIEYTDLCFITDSGHQHFLGTVETLAGVVTTEHLKEALFGPWRYADKGLSLRWDPDDAKEYALRWRDPSVGGVSAVWGANRLAFEGLPLLPTVPTRRGLQTTGFRTEKRVHEFTWPIWLEPVSLDTARSLLSLPDLQQSQPPREKLYAMGIGDVFRSQRARIGQGANFKVSFRPARAV